MLLYTIFVENIFICLRFISPYLVVELLGHQVDAYLTLWEITRPYPFYYQQYESASSSMALPTFRFLGYSFYWSVK